MFEGQTAEEPAAESVVAYSVAAVVAAAVGIEMTRASVGYFPDEASAS